jgi:hypothetical protein
MSNYLGSKSYLAMKPETTAGTAVKPTAFCPLVSESIKTILGLAPDRRMKGLDWKSDDLLAGDRKHEGDIVIYADGDNLGHLLNMTYLKGTTTGDETGYTHPFTVGSPDSYTIEIQKGPYAQRYFGVKADQLKVEFVDQKMQVTASVKAMGQFSVSALKEALSGAVTSLKLSSAYDMKPNSGLAVGDVIVVMGDNGVGVEATLTSVNADGETVGFSSITVTGAIGNRVYLKAQTPSYTGIVNPFFLGDTLIGVGANETASTTNAGAKSTATGFYQFAFTLKNNLLDAPASGSKDPFQLLPQTREAEITARQLFETEAQHLDWLNSVKQAITIIATGDEITAGGTHESLTVKFHKVKLTNNEETLEMDSLIFDTQTFEALYDSSDGYAIVISLVNKTAGTVY